LSTSFSDFVEVPVLEGGTHVLVILGDCKMKLFAKLVAHRMVLLVDANVVRDPDISG
jgi:hypothetical protein